MKNLVGALLFLALAFYVGSELYERAKGKDWLGAPFGSREKSTRKSLPSKDSVPRSPSIRDWEAPAYPARMELSNADGRQLRVTLLGRDRTHIYFLRHGDDEQFSYAIEDLDTASREKVSAYPESQMNHKQKESRKLHALHVRNLEEQIARINERSSAIKKEHRQSGSQTERRTLLREYEQLQQKRLAFEKEMEEYQ